MATFQAAHVRAVAIELQEKVLTLYPQLLPIFRATSQMTLNGLDADLPAPFDLKVLLDTYKALKIETLKLEWVTALQAAAPGDVLTYPPPPAGSGMVIFDETLTFTETLIY